MLLCFSSIGQSVEGRELWAMEVSAADKSDHGIPQVKIVAGIHGNENVGRELALELIWDLCNKYEPDYSIAEVSLLVEFCVKTLILCGHHRESARHQYMIVGGFPTLSFKK